jgi:hypothetical protein
MVRLETMIFQRFMESVDDSENRVSLGMISHYRKRRKQFEHSILRGAHNLYECINLELWRIRNGEISADRETSSMCNLVLWRLQELVGMSYDRESVEESSVEVIRFEIARESGCSPSVIENLGFSYEFSSDWMTHLDRVVIADEKHEPLKLCPAQYMLSKNLEMSDDRGKSLLARTAILPVHDDVEGLISTRPVKNGMIVSRTTIDGELLNHLLMADIIRVYYNLEKMLSLKRQRALGLEWHNMSGFNSINLINEKRVTFEMLTWLRRIHTYHAESESCGLSEWISDSCFLLFRNMPWDNTVSSWELDGIERLDRLDDDVDCEFVGYD